MYTVDTAHLYMHVQMNGETCRRDLGHTSTYLSLARRSSGRSSGWLCGCRVCIEAEDVLDGFDAVVEVQAGVGVGVAVAVGVRMEYGKHGTGG
jgi:hypothetical protein